MSEDQNINVNGIKYRIVDSIQNFRAEDSFIHPKNKLAQFKGNGESKKHVGSYGENSIDKINLDMRAIYEDSVLVNGLESNEKLIIVGQQELTEGDSVVVAES